MKKIKESLEGILAAVVIVGLFVLVSSLVQSNIVEIRKFIDSAGFLGIVAYIFVSSLAVFAAPFSSIPLIPIAAHAWGIFWAGTFNVIGWTIGSAIAFWISKKFGVPIVRRVISLKKIQKIQDRIPESNVFWYLIFLRIVLPIDLLSYALGLFANISWRMYLTTTIIGIIPFAFISSYIGVLPLSYQIIFAFVGVLIAAIIILIIWQRNKKIRG